jgi:XTP/dITP diphosphohydrolase
MGNLVYVTSNKGKILSAMEAFNIHGLELEWYNHDCNEPMVNDIEYISKYKVLEAYSLINQPCFVVDSGFYIDNYPQEPGFPGAFPKRAIGNGEGILKLLEKMRNVTNRSCKFIDCLTYYDGLEFKIFKGISEGTLSYEKRGIEQVNAKSDLWYVFIPKNYNKTLAEMTDEERNNRNDNRTSAIKDFIEWYKNNNLENKKIIRKVCNG